MRGALPLGARPARQQPPDPAGDAPRVAAVAQRRPGAGEQLGGQVGDAAGRPVRTSTPGPPVPCRAASQYAARSISCGGSAAGSSASTEAAATSTSARISPARAPRPRR
ncbi:hypothetical protein [Actinomadura sp. CNU-125]|uniref:hypothetical protein n=1 Tax=Actinomadura sp. CNU-125 TaxID=1904961 RepID=UPI0021CCD1E0|nr:hypothetical protein [Actinomadura sp. CNU-125]